MYLMLKDTPVLQFDLDKGLFHVMNRELLPLRLRYIPESDNSFPTYRKGYDLLISFLSGRVLNLDRENAKKILNALKLTQSQSPLDRAKIAISVRAVSVIDCFWLKEENEKLSWNDVNVRKVSLSEAVAHIALHGSSLTIEGIPHTPELTGLGAYAKAWIRENDTLLLYKKGFRGDTESKIEVMVSRLLDKLGISHVPYELTKHENDIVCSCPCIANDELSIASFEDFEFYCNQVGKNAELEIKKMDSKHFYEMLVVDYLISNADRHGQNWGVYVDNDTGKVIGLHPLFDHNNSFDKERMKDPEGGPCISMKANKTQREAALYAIQRCNIKVSDAITRKDFLTEEQYLVFKNRAKELNIELYP